MFDGFVKVIYWAGFIFAIVLVFAVVGTVNQHAKLTSMSAVYDGIDDVFTWAGGALNRALSHL